MIVLSEQAQTILANTGWYEGRNIEVTGTVTFLEAKGCIVTRNKENGEGYDDCWKMVNKIMRQGCYCNVPIWRLWKKWTLSLKPKYAKLD